MHDPHIDRSDTTGETIISTTEHREMESLSEEITATIVEHSEKSYEQVGPLGELLDTDALDNLFDPAGANGHGVDGHVAFRFEDWHVAVDSSGMFRITRTE